MVVQSQLAGDRDRELRDPVLVACGVSVAHLNRGGDRLNGRFQAFLQGERGYPLFARGFRATRRTDRRGSRWRLEAVSVSTQAHNAVRSFRGLTQSAGALMRGCRRHRRAIFLFVWRIGIQRYRRKCLRSPRRQGAAGNLAALSELASPSTAQARRLEAVINNLLQGVCIFDREGRLILSNPRYAEIYHLAPEHVRPGATLTEITERQMAAGTSPMATHAWTAVSELGPLRLRTGGQSKFVVSLPQTAGGRRHMRT